MEKTDEIVNEIEKEMKKLQEQIKEKLKDIDRHIHNIHCDTELEMEEILWVHTAELMKDIEAITRYSYTYRTLAEILAEIKRKARELAEKMAKEYAQKFSSK